MIKIILGTYVLVSAVATITLFIVQFIGADEEDWEGFFLSPKWIKDYSTMNIFGIIFTTILLLIAVPLYEIVAIMYWLCHIEFKRKKVK